MNKAELEGNVGRVQELQYVGQNTALLKFSVATSEFGKPDAQGNKPEPKTTWHNIVVWGKQAQELAAHLTKGSKVIVRGRIETKDYLSKKYFDAQGTAAKMWSTQIVAQSVRIFINTKPASSGGYAPAPAAPAPARAPAYAPPPPPAAPAPAYAPAPPPAAPPAPPQGGYPQDEEDDLPF